MIALPFLPRRHLACPYCSETFPEWQIEFRCSGRPGPGGQRCEPLPEPQQQNHFGSTGEPPIDPMAT